MSNNFNNDLANQNTSQQNISIEPLETSKGIAQHTNQSQYSSEFQDSFVRALFFKRLYCCLIGEFMYNIMMISISLYTGIQESLANIQPEGRDLVIVTPNWLFYVSFIFSILLSLTIYFGGITVRKGPLKILIIVAFQIFYAFTFSTICIMMYYGMHEFGVWLTLFNIFLILLCLNFAYCCSGEVSCLCKTFIIVVPPLFFTSILIPGIKLFYGIYLGSVTISIMYGCYLTWEASLLIEKGKGKLNLSPDDYQIGSLLLNAIIVQPIVRVVDIIYGCMY